MMHCLVCFVQWADAASHCWGCDRPGVEGGLPAALSGGYRTESYAGDYNGKYLLGETA